jgi:O-methyltransferase involved in polyketide biosynthesis
VVEETQVDRDPGGPPPPGVDVSVAHPARVWNFWLGGHDYFKADRLTGSEIAREFPHLPETARAERAFLVRATRYLAGPARIRQFLDLGSGLPAGGNTHEIAQRIAADSRIVYVDNDPVVLAHAKALLDSVPVSAEGAVGYVDADLRDVTAVLRGAAVTLDHRQPVALIMLGILGYVEDHGAARSITSQLLGALPSGSYLVIADAGSTSDDMNRAQLRYNARLAASSGTEPPYLLRRPDELASFFDGLDVVEPGVVPCSRWKPDRAVDGAAAESPAAHVYCGVARKL